MAMMMLALPVGLLGLRVPLQPSVAQPATFTPMEAVAHADDFETKDSIRELLFVRECRLSTIPSGILCREGSPVALRQMEQSSKIDWREIGLARDLKLPQRPQLSIRERARRSGAEVKRGVSFGNLGSSVSRIVSPRRVPQEAARDAEEVPVPLRSA